MVTYNTDYAPRMPGQLDPNFGVNGIIIPDTSDGTVLTVAWDEGERRLTYANSIFEDNRFRIYRTLMNGAVDTTFGANEAGYVEGSFNEQDESSAQRLLLQHDGKTVVIGFTRTNIWRPLPAVARFEKNGEWDQSFGTAGNVIPDVIPAHATRTAIPSGALLHDGRVLVTCAYSSTNSGPPDYTGVLVCLKQDGTLDDSFGENGVVEIYHRTSTEITSVAIQRDGKIVVGGVIDNSQEGGMAQLILARLTTSGQIDQTFGSTGYSVFGKPDEDYSLRDLRLDDDRIICAGRHSRKSFDASCYVMRFNDNGNPDRDFQDGAPVFVIPDPADDHCTWDTLGVQPDGKIVAAGTTSKFTTTRQVFGRFLVNGDRDLELSDTGLIVSAPGHYADLVVQDSARRIVIVGRRPQGPAVYGIQA